MGERIQDAEVFFKLMTQLRQAGVSASPPEMAHLSPPLMALLEQVAQHPGSGIRDLAHRLNRSAPTISIEIRHLEEAGFVSRHPHPKDKRSVQVFLTPKGEDLHQKVQAARRETFARLLSGLSSDERQTLLRLLKKAVQNLNEEALASSARREKA